MAKARAIESQVAKMFIQGTSTINRRVQRLELENTARRLRRAASVARCLANKLQRESANETKIWGYSLTNAERKEAELLATILEKGQEKA